MRKLLSILIIGLMACLSPCIYSAPPATEDGQANTPIFEIPAHLANRWGGLSREEFDVAQQLVSLGVRQDSELQSRLQDIVSQPAAFTSNEIDRALDDLLKLTVNLRKLDWIKAVLGSNPPVQSWSVVDGSLHNSRMDNAVANLAKRAALKPGCELMDLQLKGLPEVFWYEYAMAKFDSARQSCGALPSSDWLSQMSISRLDRLRAHVGDESRSFAHAELAFAFQESCKTAKPSSIENRLGICGWTRERIDTGPRRRAPLKKKDSFQFVPLKHSAFAAVSKASVEAVILKESTTNKADTVARTVLEISDSRKPGITSGYWLSPDRTRLIFLIDIEPPAPSDSPTYLSPLEKWKRYLVFW